MHESFQFREDSPVECGSSVPAPGQTTPNLRTAAKVQSDSFMDSIHCLCIYRWRNTAAVHKHDRDSEIQHRAARPLLSFFSKVNPMNSSDPPDLDRG